MRDPLQFLKRNETISDDEHKHSAMDTRRHTRKPTLQRVISALLVQQGSKASGGGHAGGRGPPDVGDALSWGFGVGVIAGQEVNAWRKSVSCTQWQANERVRTWMHSKSRRAWQTPVALALKQAYMDATVSRRVCACFWGGHSSPL
jgi:hypothetical protein